MNISSSRSLALVSAAVLATLCAAVSAQSNQGYTEPYYDQYEPVYIEDKIMRVIKEVRGLTDPVYPLDQPVDEGGDRRYDNYHRPERGFNELRGDNDDDDDDDD